MSLDQLVGWIRAVLESEAVPFRVARVEADVMAEADLHGVPSHGVRMLAGLQARSNRWHAVGERNL